MGIEAQNAFLKTLEEPPVDTCIIITSSTAKPLLPTIRSRAQSITILPVTAAAAEAFYGAKHQPLDIQNAYALSDGNAGLLNALLANQDHIIRTQVASAKQLLGLGVFERLAKVEELSKEKSAAVSLIDALNRIARAALRSAAKNGNPESVVRWHNTLGLIDTSRISITKNANTKIVLSNLFIGL